MRVRVVSGDCIITDHGHPPRPLNARITITWTMDIADTDNDTGTSEDISEVTTYMFCKRKYMLSKKNEVYGLEQ